MSSKPCSASKARGRTGGNIAFRSPDGPHRPYLHRHAECIRGETPWHTPWMARVLPVVARIADRHPSRTVFTRFVPPRRPDAMPGSWQRYYERWRELILERIDPRLIAGPAIGGARPSRRGDRQEAVFTIFRTAIGRPVAPAWNRQPRHHRSRDRRLRSRRRSRCCRPRLPRHTCDGRAVQFVGRHARCVAYSLSQPFQSADRDRQ